jgi:hypothetical protein
LIPAKIIKNNMKKPSLPLNPVKLTNKKAVIKARIKIPVEMIRSRLEAAQGRIGDT